MSNNNNNNNNNNIINKGPIMTFFVFLIICRIKLFSLTVLPNTFIFGDQKP